MPDVALPPVAPQLRRAWASGRLAGRNGDAKTSNPYRRMSRADRLRFAAGSARQWDRGWKIGAGEREAGHV